MRAVWLVAVLAAADEVLDEVVVEKALTVEVARVVETLAEEVDWAEEVETATEEALEVVLGAAEELVGGATVLEVLSETLVTAAALEEAAADEAEEKREATKEKGVVVVVAVAVVLVTTRELGLEVVAVVSAFLAAATFALL